MPELLREKIGLAKDIIFIATVFTPIFIFIFTLLTYGMFSIYGDSIRDSTQDWLGINENRRLMEEALGYNAVLVEKPSMAYVRQPVYGSSQICLVSFLGRTEVGLNYEAVSITPVFTDDNGSTFTGITFTPPIQLGSNIQRIETCFDQPKRMALGQTFVTLQIKYEGPDGTAFESTSAVPYTRLGDNPHDNSD